MKSAHFLVRGNRPIAGSRAAFSLIELVGVLAIMAILAGVIAPNALKSIDRAAVRAEATTVHTLGEQVKLYLRNHGTVPTTANWSTQLATYADLSPTDVLRNRRSINRVFLLDPATSPAPRALLLSSMRPGLNLPTAANINTAARFDGIWTTADGAVPPTSSWNGWNNWGNVANSGDHLVIERVNLLPVYLTDLQSLTVTLNNNGATTVSYNLVPAAGGAQSAVNVAAGATVVLTNLRPRDRVNLYNAAGGSGLDYSYVLSTSGKTFDFGGTQWLPQ